MVASLLSIALLLLMFSSARATRGEISPADVEESGEATILQVPRAAYAEVAPEGSYGAADQPKSVAVLPLATPGAQANRQSVVAALLDVLASLGGSTRR